MEIRQYNKKRARIKIQPCLFPISYEKPFQNKCFDKGNELTTIIKKNDCNKRSYF